MRCCSLLQEKQTLAVPLPSYTCSLCVFNSLLDAAPRLGSSFAETTCFLVRQSEACELFLFAIFSICKLLFDSRWPTSAAPWLFSFLLPPSSYLSAAPPPPPSHSIGLLFIQVCCTHLAQHCARTPAAVVPSYAGRLRGRHAFRKKKCDM